MPEVAFRIRWPDGAEEACYSPSTVIRDVFAAGTAYTVGDFLGRSRDGLTRASDRVEAKSGHRCNAAAAQLARIERAADRFHPEEHVTCLSIT